MISYFDESFYLGEKLAQLKVVDPNGDLNGGKPWTTTSEVRAAFTQNGLTAEQHFEQYGQYEGLSPVAEFVVAEYLAMKAEQLNAIKQDGRTDWSADSALAAIQAAGMSAWSHYVQFGDSEGLSPSYALDEAKYCQAKAEAMNAAAGEGEKSDWTADEIKAAINDAGMTVLDHFETYAGKGPGEAAKIDYPVDHKPFQYDLTTGVDTINGTAADEVINGATGTSRVATLNEGDKIDGGDGTDTLNVDMAKSFTGFKGDGFMKNVEIVNLDSSANSAVTFSGKGVEGVQTYNLSGTVNLSDLSAAGIAVNLADRAKDAASITFADAAVKGKEDALTLGLHNVGTVDADKGDTNVDITFNGIENLTVNAAGENVVTLKGGDAVKTVAVTGDGDLKVTVGETSLESVDASAATGDLDVDLTAATSKLESVTLGSGDDVLKLGDNSSKEISIDGGAGDDEVVLKGAQGTKELQMSNVETLTVAANTAALTLSGARTTGLQTVKLDTLGGNVTLADFQNNSLDLLLVGTTSKNVTVADVPTLNITVGDDDKFADNMSGDVTAADATSVSLSVADGATFSGGLVANQATSLSVDSVSDGNLAFGGTTDLSSIENMVLKSNGNVTFTGVAHLGGKSDYITVDASAVKGDFTAEFDAYAKGGASLEVTGSHLAKNDIMANGGYGDISMTGGISDDKITLTDVGDADIRLNTGIGTDVVSITADAKAEDIVVSGELGNNTGDKITVDGTAANGIKIDISGLEGYVESTITGSAKADTIIGSSQADTIWGGAGQDTLHGGAGADQFVLAKAADMVGANGANVNSINDFMVGEDKFFFDVSGTVSNGGTALTGAGDILKGVTFTAATAKMADFNVALSSNAVVNSLADVYAKLTTTLDAAAFGKSAVDGTATVARVVTFSTGDAAGTYLVINDATDAFQAADDVVINITGIEGTLSAADFTFA